MKNCCLNSGFFVPRGICGKGFGPDGKLNTEDALPTLGSTFLVVHSGGFGVFSAGRISCVPFQCCVTSYEMQPEVGLRDMWRQKHLGEKRGVLMWISWTRLVKSQWDSRKKTNHDECWFCKRKESRVIWAWYHQTSHKFHEIQCYKLDVNEEWRKGLCDNAFARKF